MNNEDLTETTDLDNININDNNNDNDNDDSNTGNNPLSDDDEIDIYIYGEKLEEVDHAKYLGTLIDNKLNWSYQIKAVSLKNSKGIGLLAKARHFVPSSILRSLYFSFMNSYIDYNLLNYGMASETNLNVINSKIKKAVRIISFKDRDEHTDPLFKELGIMPLDKSIELKYAKFMWRLHNGYLPESLSNNFRSNSRTGFSMPISRLKSLNQFVRFAGPKLWRELPSTLTSKPSLDSFTKAYKVYLGYNYINPNNNNNNNNLT